MNLHEVLGEVGGLLDGAGIAHMLTGSLAGSLHGEPRSTREEFIRRRPADLGGVPVMVASPEDTLLAKLEWARLGGSQRQIDDAAGVLRQQGEGIDDAYLDRWDRELGVAGELAAARRQASS